MGALRILRALRLVGRNDGLKVAVRALILAGPSILAITLIMFLIFTVFAVACISYFKGRMSTCKEPIFEVDTKWDCLDAGGAWVPGDYNWDNLLNALAQLFVIATGCSLGELLATSLASRGIDLVPKEGHVSDNSPWALFFLYFNVVGCFFFLNLFVAVVINTFHEEHSRVEGSELLTDQ